MKQSVQMWDNRKLCVLAGEPCYVSIAPEGFTFIICQEHPDLFSAISVECGLRVCYGDTRNQAYSKLLNIFTQYNKNDNLADYLHYTTEAYRAYLAYVWARAGMWAHTPSQLLTQPRFPLFNHHHLEDV